MKKILAILLVLAMALSLSVSLASCSYGDDGTTNAGNNNAGNNNNNSGGNGVNNNGSNNSGNNGGNNSGNNNGANNPGGNSGNNNNGGKIPDGVYDTYRGSEFEIRADKIIMKDYDDTCVYSYYVDDDQIVITIYDVQFHENTVEYLESIGYDVDEYIEEIKASIEPIRMLFEFSEHGFMLDGVEYYNTALYALYDIDLYDDEYDPVPGATVRFIVNGSVYKDVVSDERGTAKIYIPLADNPQKVSAVLILPEGYLEYTENISFDYGTHTQVRGIQKDRRAQYTGKIGVQSGTVGQYFVEGDEDWGFDGIAGYTAQGYLNSGMAVQDLINGNIDYAITDRELAFALANKMSGVKVIDIPLVVREYAIGVDKAQADLYTAVNAALAKAKETGVFDAIVNAYATGEGINPVTSATLDLSKRGSQFVVATNACFAPFEYKESDKFVGIDMELAAYIASELGMELVIVDMDFDSVISSVGTNGFDVAIAAITVNEPRELFVDFTECYYDASQVLIVRSGDNSFNSCNTAEDVIEKLEELATK